MIIVTRSSREAKSIPNDKNVNTTGIYVPLLNCFLRCPAENYRFGGCRVYDRYCSFTYQSNIFFIAQLPKNRYCHA
jgi:hypothetical protein